LNQLSSIVSISYVTIFFQIRHANLLQDTDPAF
jgi:hypothetical protein